MASKKQVAKKFDSNKIDLSFVSINMKKAVAEALQYGASKYGRNNYTSGLDSNRLVAALERHLELWKNGQDLDDESGLNHLSHAAATIQMILDTQALGNLIDNRTQLTYDLNFNYNGRNYNE